uniref:Uncharacterized protein n=1 Tax=Ditylum brightwellii TaxID=49249 RepID=A0A6S8Z4Z7_9STRA|mmetsp:Transcript_4429/g.5871  ORF Transcript_4429/g.5871 Transcript_4429/m.5871 type:complete len:168 (-) Transcript_4429:483-986(-)|eukprot:882705-Ditylum_brightwellii.AAC.1
MLAQRSIVRNGLKIASQSLKHPPTTLTATPWRSNGLATRSIHFLPLLGLWGVKHISTWTLYNACKNYGWHRVYRRLLEQNRLINKSNPAIQSNTKDVIRMAIEIPPKFVAQISQYSGIIVPFLEKVADRAVTRMPGFLVAAAKFIIGSQKPVKVLRDLAEASAKIAK